MTPSSTLSTPIAMAGPLTVSKANPRYFTHADDPSGRAIYLTGSHIWNNLQDGLGPGAMAPPGEPETFDFDGYLHFLEERGHNLIRLWRWEHIRSQAAGGDYHLDMSAQPWARTGPGTAKDGRPRFDLDQFDDAYFDRLRERVEKARDAGIYVDVLLFDGWALHLSPPPDSIEGHPFHGHNNINGVAARSIDDLQVLPLEPKVASIEEAYIKKVIDTLHDLPNILWEVANESTGDGKVDQEFAQFLGMDEPPTWGDSTEWQYWVIDVVKRYEHERAYEPHPIGMTMQFPVANQTEVNEPLLRSRAAWVSPGYDDEMFKGGGHPMAPGAQPSRWFVDPPAADGAKVVITDTDHYAAGQGDALWAWKSFLRGHNPILMDFGLLDGFVGGEGTPFAAFEPARWAMGDTRRYAERIDLARMPPRGDLTSTDFALASPGHGYLVLEPKGDAKPFRVDLAPGRYDVEWFAVADRRTETGEPVDVGTQGPIEFISPFRDGPSVLYLAQRS